MSLNKAVRDSHLCPTVRTLMTEGPSRHSQSVLESENAQARRIIKRNTRIRPCPRSISSLSSLFLVHPLQPLLSSFGSSRPRHLQQWHPEADPSQPPPCSHLAHRVTLPQRQKQQQSASTSPPPFPYPLVRPDFDGSLLRCPPISLAPCPPSVPGRPGLVS